MVDADNPTSSSAPTQSARALARLSELLQLEPPLAAPYDLTAARLAELKPLVERTAFSNPPLAEELADLLVQIATEAALDGGSRGLAHWIRGNVAFLLDRPLDALADFEAAEGWFAAEGDRLQSARMSVGKISALDKAGRYAEALAAGRAALSVLLGSPDGADQRRVASLYNGLGIASEHVGRYVEALEAYERKLNWWRARADDPAAALEAARSRVNMGLVNARLGQYTEAHDAFTEALRTLAAHCDNPRAAQDAARCAMNLAWLEALRGSPAEVVRTAFAEARTLRQRIDPAGESTDLALLDLFEAEWRAGRSDGGEDDPAAVARLQARFEAAGLAYEAARSGLLRGRLAARSGDAAGAEHTYEALADAAAVRGDPEIGFLAGVGQARVLAAGGARSRGRDTLEQVIAGVEAARATLLAEEHRAGFLSDKLIAYRELASLCLAEGDDARALAAIERSKARVLAEVLAPGAASSSRSGEADALAGEQRELQARLGGLGEGPGEARRELERELQSVRRRWSHLTARYAPQPAEGLARADVCGRLPADTLLLAYGALPERVVAFAFDRSGPLARPIEVGPLPTADQLRLDLNRIAAIGRLPRALAERTAAQHIRSAQVPLGEWYEQYLRPLDGLLRRYARLLIAPDDLLNSLPFSALYDRTAGAYLVQTHEVLVAPSLTTWAMLTERPGTDAVGALIVGNSCGGRLPRAVAEAQAVAGLTAGTLLIEEGATRAAFTAAAPHARLIHIATHGVYRADAPAFSYLELADGRLEAFDIAQLQLAAETVVLSACETGAGRLTGNELMGLARAFLHAGARSVVATHWAVDDAATGELALTLVQSGAFSPARALREAKAQRLLGNEPLTLAHPYFWGSLEVVGAETDVTALN